MEHGRTWQMVPALRLLLAALVDDCSDMIGCICGFVCWWCCVWRFVFGSFATTIDNGSIVD